MEELGEPGRPRFDRKWRAAAERHEADHSEAVDVTRRRRCGRTANAFRSEVDRLAEHLTGLGDRGDVAEIARQAEVEQLHLTGYGDHDVLEVDIPVHDRPALAVDDEVVGVVQGLGDTLEHTCPDARVAGALPLGQALEYAAQRLAVQQLHHDVVLTCLVAELDDLDHVRVVELRRQVGLTQKALHRHRIVAQALADALDRELALNVARPGPMGDIDLASPAGLHESVDDVTSAQEGGRFALAHSMLPGRPAWMIAERRDRRKAGLSGRDARALGRDAFADDDSGTRDRREAGLY